MIIDFTNNEKVLLKRYLSFISDKIIIKTNISNTKNRINIHIKNTTNIIYVFKNNKRYLIFISEVSNNNEYSDTNYSNWKSSIKYIKKYLYNKVYLNK